MTQQTESTFSVLNSIDVSEHVKAKNGLSYLPWSWAWAELLKRYPDSTSKTYKNANNINYHTDGNTCWVEVGVTVNGIEHIEELPIMDFKNRAILLTNITQIEVNKAIQRCRTKAIARHGLGLYIYSGEDLPSDSGVDAINNAISNVGKSKQNTNPVQQQVPQQPQMSDDQKRAMAKSLVDNYVAKNQRLGADYMAKVGNDQQKYYNGIYKALNGNANAQPNMVAQALGL